MKHTALHLAVFGVLAGAAVSRNLVNSGSSWAKASFRSSMAPQKNRPFVYSASGDGERRFQTLIGPSPKARCQIGRAHV